LHSRRLRNCANAHGAEVSISVQDKASSRPPSGDGELVSAARDGNLRAFDELVRRYQRRAVAVAYSLLNNRDDAMEVAQEAFLKAYEKLNTLSEPGRFGHWLMRIVSNLSLNRRRARALRKGESLEFFPSDGEQRSAAARPDGRAISPPEAASAGELREQIRMEIDNLPDAQRQSLVLFSLNGLPQREVANILGISVEAVKWNVFMARKALKDKLKDYL